MKPPLTTSHLLQAIQNAQVGQFGKSLAAIRSAKALEPGNVHILALENQLIRLSEFTDVGALSKEEQEENFEVLRILADRAKQNLRDHLYSLDQLIMGPDFSRQPVLSGGQRQATRNALIRQYLLRADQCLARGDREGAVFEVHRIYVIDPGNQEARNQEARISAWQESPATVLEHAPESEKHIIPEQTTSVGRTDLAEPSLAVTGTEVESSPGDQKTEPERGSRLAASLRRRTLVKVLRVAAALAILACFISFLLWKNQDDHALMQESLGRLDAAGSESRGATEDRDAQTSPSLSRDTHAPARQESAQHEESGTEIFNSPAVAAELWKDLGDQETTPIPRIPEPAIRTKNNLSEEKVAASANLQPGSISTGARRSEAVPAQQRVASGGSEPRITHLAPFDIPEELQRDGIEAEVVVQVQISAEGKPIQAEIIASTDPALNQAVVKAIMRSQFSPGKLQGSPVTAWVTIPLRFRN